jgi:FkbM family methyltransferase
VAYSQNNEEDILLQLFRDCPPGRLLDVGAWNGRTFSNSLALIEKGWGGVLVEPSPGPFQRLLAEHRGRTKVDLVCAALAPKPGILPFYATDDAVSTLSEEHRATWAGEVSFGTAFNFINIDTEGSSVDLLIDLIIPQETRVLCVEFDGRLQEVKDLMYARGFDFVTSNSENAIFVDTTWNRKSL